VRRTVTKEELCGDGMERKEWGGKWRRWDLDSRERWDGIGNGNGINGNWDLGV
jgi:hypothetical protein